MIAGSAAYTALNNRRTTSTALNSPTLQRADNILLRDEGMTSMTVIPIHDGETVYGQVTIYCIEKHSFDQVMTDQATAHVREWLSQLDEGFSDLDHGALTTLAEELLALPSVCRVGIYVLDAGQRQQHAPARDRLRRLDFTQRSQPGNRPAPDDAARYRDENGPAA